MHDVVDAVNTDRFKLNRLTPGPQLDSLVVDVHAGLTGSPRSLPPKYFYDETGSKLFDQICQTKEYYLTRAESALLRKYADDIIATVKPAAIVEYGSGTSEKTELLIQAANQHNDWVHYLPLDVCEEILIEAASRLIARYPWLSIDAWHGDFLHDMQRFENHHERSLYTFLGSSLGNFSNKQAIRFLRDVRETASEDDWFLLGVDMVKDAAVLNAAYNDSDGYTAAFNLNLLNVLNQSLDGDFNTDNFIHHAFFDTDKSRIEMQLRSTREQTITLREIDLEIKFDDGEHIVTEYSRKYTKESIQQLLISAGFSPHQVYTGDNNEFMLILSSCNKFK